MEEKRIKLTSVAAAKDFVIRASKCDFDIDVYYNRVIIDAKSLLGTEPGPDPRADGLYAR